MPGSPGYGLHQARDASLQVAKPEHTIKTDPPDRRRTEPPALRRPDQLPGPGRRRAGLSRGRGIQTARASGPRRPRRRLPRVRSQHRAGEPGRPGPGLPRLLRRRLSRGFSHVTQRHTDHPFGATLAANLATRLPFITAAPCADRRVTDTLRDPRQAPGVRARRASRPSAMSYMIANRAIRARHRVEPAAGLCE